MKTKNEIAVMTINFIKQLQEMQSDIDGVNRPDPTDFDRSKELDEFALNIQEAVAFLYLSINNHETIDRLTTIGKTLVDNNVVPTDLTYDKSYSEIALYYLDQNMKAHAD